MQEGLLGNDTVIFIFKNLSFIINKERPCMVPGRVMEFLGFIRNSESMIIFFSEEKKENIMSRCERLLNEDQASPRENVSVLGMLTSIYQAVLPIHSIIGHFKCNK